MTKLKEEFPGDFILPGNDKLLAKKLRKKCGICKGRLDTFLKSSSLIKSFHSKHNFGEAVKSNKRETNVKNLWKMES